MWERRSFREVRTASLRGSYCPVRERGYVLDYRSRNTPSLVCLCMNRSKVTGMFSSRGRGARGGGGRSSAQKPSTSPLQQFLVASHGMAKFRKIAPFRHVPYKQNHEPFGTKRTRILSELTAMAGSSTRPASGLTLNTNPLAEISPTVLLSPALALPGRDSIGPARVNPIAADVSAALTPRAKRVVPETAPDRSPFSPPLDMLVVGAEFRGDCWCLGGICG